MQKFTQSRMKAIAVRKHIVNKSTLPVSGSNLSSGALVSCFGSKQIIPALYVQTLNHYGMNSVAQFTIDNTGVGNTFLRLRLGGLIAFPLAYTLFNVADGAADNAVITDDYGAGCKKVQGFSQLVNNGAVSIKTIKISCVKQQQLDSPFFYNTIRYDTSINTLTQNIGFTAEKSDALTTLAVARGNWILGFNQYFEFGILPNVSLTIFLEIYGIANVKAFSTIGDR